MQPSIFIGRFELAEPVTVLTDVMVGMVCLYAYRQLKQQTKPLKELAYLRIFFVSMAAATIYGGVVGHGLMPHLSHGWKLPGWLISMISIGFLERTAIAYAQRHVSKRWRQFWLSLNWLELAIFVALVCITLNFKWVEVHAGYGILVVCGGFFGYAWLRFQKKTSLWFLGGVAMCVISAIVFSMQWGLGIWFNHLDVSHVWMALGAWCFYLGGMKVAQEN